MKSSNSHHRHVLRCIVLEDLSIGPPRPGPEERRPAARTEQDREDDRKCEPRSDPDGRTNASGDRTLLDALFDVFRTEGEDEDLAPERSSSRRTRRTQSPLSDRVGCWEGVCEEDAEQHERDGEDRSADGADSSGPEDGVGVAIEMSHDGRPDGGADDGG